jgi:hypothetical protein
MEETRDEDHLTSFSLGEIYASSGIRRRTDSGITHEIDWALFEFDNSRLPERNHIANGQRYCQSKPPYPVQVMPSPGLSDLDVHCLGRTSGLQSGRILPSLTIVKIYGRQTPSQSYQVAGKLGVPGDSGAWVVDNEKGRACGHILAWSSRRHVAYICPMDVLLMDIGETLKASNISLPGGKALYTKSRTSLGFAHEPEIRPSTPARGDFAPLSRTISFIPASRTSRQEPEILPGTPGQNDPAPTPLFASAKPEEVEHALGAEYSLPGAEDLVPSLADMRIHESLLSSV